MSLGNLLKNLIKDVNTDNSVNGFFTPTTDQTFTSGLNYARSIADGQNVPNMISSGTSYSSAMPQGFTQADINSGAVPNPFAMISNTPPPPPPEKLPGPDEDGYGEGIGGVTIFDDIFDKKRIPPFRDITPPFGNIFGNLGFNFNPPEIDYNKLYDEVVSNIDIPDFSTFATKDDLNKEIGGIDIPTIDTKQFLTKDDIPTFNPYDFRDDFLSIAQDGIDIPTFDDTELRDLINRNTIGINSIPTYEVPDLSNYATMNDLNSFKDSIQGPVDMPMPPKQKDQLFIDDMPSFNDIPSTEYVVPEVPLNNLLNQNPPQGPVGMSPQETAKMSSQQELSNLISNKDILQEIPADDGVRNQYQVELDEFINKSPINMDTYKEELPIGSAINLGIPAVMEAVVPMAVPGLGLAQNISNNFQNDFSPSPAPSPSPSPAPSVSSFTPGIDYSSIYKFGR